MKILKCVLEKFESCFGLIIAVVDTYKGNVLWKYKNHFDYNPISNDGFLETLFSIVKDKFIYVIYVDVTNKQTQKYFLFDKFEILLSNDIVDQLRIDNALLYNCTVEGSYYIVGDSGDWVIFYDAQSDIGIVFSKNSTLILEMTEYLVTKQK